MMMPGRQPLTSAGAIGIIRHAELRWNWHATALMCVCSARAAAVTKAWDGITAPLGGWEETSLDSKASSMVNKYTYTYV